MTDQQYMTEKEIASLVFEHLLDQQYPSYDNETNFCMYRSVEGLQCAVGCLIKLEHYSSDFEGVSLADIDIENDDHQYREKPYATRERQLFDALKASGVNADDPSVLSLLTSLQQLHDRQERHVPFTKETLLKEGRHYANLHDVMEQLVEATGGAK